MMLITKILPGWLSGKESTCHCGRCGFYPLGQEGPMEEEMATHSRILTWKYTEERRLAGYSP